MAQRLYHYATMSIYAAILAWIAYMVFFGGPIR